VNPAPVLWRDPKIEHLDQALQEYAEKLAAGEFVVVAPGNIRVDKSLLPTHSPPPEK
jgi:aromatic ring-opening dioxygenase LigB subunit